MAISNLDEYCCWKQPLCENFSFGFFLMKHKWTWWNSASWELFYQNAGCWGCRLLGRSLMWHCHPLWSSTDHRAEHRVSPQWSCKKMFCALIEWLISLGWDSPNNTGQRKESGEKGPKCFLPRQKAQTRGLLDHKPPFHEILSPGEELVTGGYHCCYTGSSSGSETQGSNSQCHIISLCAETSRATRSWKTFPFLFFSGSLKSLWRSLWGPRCPAWETLYTNSRTGGICGFNSAKLRLPRNVLLP